MSVVTSLYSFLLRETIHFSGDTRCACEHRANDTSSGIPASGIINMHGSAGQSWQHGLVTPTISGCAKPSAFDRVCNHSAQEQHYAHHFEITHVYSPPCSRILDGYFSRTQKQPRRGVLLWSHDTRNYKIGERTMGLSGAAIGLLGWSEGWLVWTAGSLS